MKTKTFTERVRAIVAKIPKGESMTYKEVATKAGNPRAARAVGAIMRSNYNRDIPCHRVVKSDLPAPRPDTYYVYAILCRNMAIYIGQTQDLQQRWQQHRDGTAADYTRQNGAWKIIHYEMYGSREEAVLREKHLKTGFGRKWLKREWKAGRTRQAGGSLGSYNRGGTLRKQELLKAEGAL